MKIYLAVIFPVALVIAACADNKHYTGTKEEKAIENPQAGVTVSALKYDSEYSKHVISTGTTQAPEVIEFAKSLIGIPYKYGSFDPAQGFDCSGFITYVFNHFKISVPRSSVDFTNIEETVELRNSKPGDLILFTGTDSTIHEVGHMGIITDNNGTDISFIHSTSGKAYGVTITPLNKYYQGRFVKALRIFDSNN
jgi:cell wall-associated NlpC family hydrolase